MKTKIIHLLVISIFFLSCITNYAHAAEDYNSSRSNTSTSINTAGDEVVILVDEVKANVLSIATEMIALELKSGYTGDISVKITMGVEIERVSTPGKPTPAGPSESR